MAKKQKPTESTEVKQKKSTGAVIGTIGFSILTFLLALLFFISISMRYFWKENLISTALEKAASSNVTISQMEITEDGQTQNLGQWVYTWYMWNSKNLTPEYAEAAMAHPAVQEKISTYFDELGAYFLRQQKDLPVLDAGEFCDMLQYDMASDLEKQTGIVFAEKDRWAIMYNAEDDVEEWNESLQESIGSGAGKVAVRFFFTLPGVIMIGTLLGICILLWLILAFRGHWKKGKMLTVCGIMAAAPGLLAVLFCGVLLFLVVILDCISALSFVSDTFVLPTLLKPFAMYGGEMALAGAIVTVIGILIQCAGKKKARRVAAATAPETEAFVYMPESAAAAAPQTTESTEAVCPSCGAPIAEGEKFCGHCGSMLE